MELARLAGWITAVVIDPCNCCSEFGKIHRTPDDVHDPKARPYKWFTRSVDSCLLAMKPECGWSVRYCRDGKHRGQYHAVYQPSDNIYPGFALTPAYALALALIEALKGEK